MDDINLVEPSLTENSEDWPTSITDTIPVEEDDLHDKSLLSGARISRCAQESAWLFHSSVFIASRFCLSARFLRVTQNQTSIRCIGLLRPSQKIE
jgi:hypothetical protein